MTKLPRRTVRELFFLYEAEDTLRDIFVEGEFDVAVVVQFLRDIGHEHVMVRSIDCIES